MDMGAENGHGIGGQRKRFDRNELQGSLHTTPATEDPVVYGSWSVAQALASLRQHQIKAIPHCFLRVVDACAAALIQQMAERVVQSVKRACCRRARRGLACTPFRRSSHLCEGNLVTQRRDCPRWQRGQNSCLTRSLCPGRSSCPMSWRLELSISSVWVFGQNLTSARQRATG